MMNSLKTAILRSIQSASVVVGRTRVGRVAFEPIASGAMLRTTKVARGSVQLTITVPNSLNHFRASTFATKEPETLDWLDGIPEGSILWDIGANIGLYSCYGAKARGCRVVAFEPSVFNLELLARNIFLNQLTDRITIFSLPLSDRIAVSTLNMTSTLWGGALSTFDKDIGFDGAALKKCFEFRTLGVSLDDCVARLGMTPPDYIKMDVDGIEHLILGGGTEVLKQVKGVSIEINDAFTEQAEVSQRLLEAGGLRFIGKAHSQMIDDSETFNRTFNQVWAR
jgi:FkbM family methyltransferase